MTLPAYVAKPHELEQERVDKLEAEVLQLSHLFSYAGLGALVAKRLPRIVFLPSLFRNYVHLISRSKILIIN